MNEIKLCRDLETRINNIKSQEGVFDKLDTRNEYNQLSELLRGQGKVTGAQKDFVEGMLRDYEEEYMVRQEVKNRVMELIKSGKENKADDNVEIQNLKNYLKTDGLSKEEKKWIKNVINGREVIFQGKDTKKEEEDIAVNKCMPSESNEQVKESNKLREVENENLELDETSKKDQPESNRTKENSTNEKSKEAESKNTKSKKSTDEVKDEVKNSGTNQEAKDSTKGEDRVIAKGKVKVNPDGSEELVIENDTIAESDTIATDKKQKVTQKELTFEEALVAEKNGYKVAKDLIGITSGLEQDRVTEIIKNEINSGNVIAFLKGYEENSSGGNHFFEQLESEYGFKNAQNLILDVGMKLQTYLQNKYGLESVEAIQIAKILAENIINEKLAEQLDNMVQTELQK